MHMAVHDMAVHAYAVRSSKVHQPAGLCQATACLVHLVCPLAKDDQQRASHKHKPIRQLIFPVSGRKTWSILYIEATNDGRKHSPHLVQR
jgi:hypothetical protein